MRRKLTIGRWTAELYQRAIYLHRGPNPDCDTCFGRGGYDVGGWVGEDGDVTVDPETEMCGCWNPDGWRIPLWFRSRVASEPF